MSASWAACTPERPRKRAFFLPQGAPRTPLLSSVSLASFLLFLSHLSRLRDERNGGQ